jgi:putative transposase
MKRKRYAGEQIAFALRQAESGTSVEDICRKMRVSEPPFHRWKKQFAGMGVVEIRRLKQLEEENAKLKRLVAGLTLDKRMLPHTAWVRPWKASCHMPAYLWQRLTALGSRRRGRRC